MNEIPAFEEALENLQAILIKQNHPTAIVWIFKEAIYQSQRGTYIAAPIPPSNERIARLVYEAGRIRGQVCLHALAIFDSTTVATVWYPLTENDRPQGWEQGGRVYVTEPLPIAIAVTGNWRWRLHKLLPAYRRFHKYYRSLLLDRESLSKTLKVLKQYKSKVHHEVKVDPNYQDQVLSATAEFAEYVFEGRRDAADMSRLIEVTDRLPLKNLEAWERLIRWQYVRSLEMSAGLRGIDSSKVKQFLSWVDVCHPDGFKRERLLRSLNAGAPNRFFFALAVRRLNDWVSQVQQAACETLPAIAKNTAPQDVIDVMCSILPHWNEWGRMEPKSREVLLKMATDDTVVGKLLNYIVMNPSGPMALTLAQLSRSPVIDSHLGSISSTAVQPAVRARAYKYLLEGKTTWTEGRTRVWVDIKYCKQKLVPVVKERQLSVDCSFVPTLRKAIVDRSPVVRRVAGEALIKNLSLIGDESAALAKILAADDYKGLAERGRFILRELAKTE